MRVIYLSTTKERNDFGNKASTMNFFKGYQNGKHTEFDFSSRKIDKKKFEVGEDIIFLRPEKNSLGNWTYEIVAYCKSASEIKDRNDASNPYPLYFAIDPKTLKIFEDGMDVEELNKFIYQEKINGISKANFFTDNIVDNKFTGARSWPYFNKEDSKKILSKLKDIVFERYSVYK